MLGWLFDNVNDKRPDPVAVRMAHEIDDLAQTLGVLTAFGLTPQDLGDVRAAQRDLAPMVKLAFQGIGPRLLEARSDHEREGILAESEGSFARIVLSRVQDTRTKLIRGCAAHLLMVGEAVRILESKR